MRALPNMTVVAPADADEMRRLMPQTLDVRGPVYIRLGKGGDPIISRDKDGFAIGRAIELRAAGEVGIITTGVMVARALEAADMLAETGIECGVLNMHTIKPLDEDKVLELAGRVRLLVTIEEHTLIGGLGSAVCDVLADRMSGQQPAIRRLGLPDIFPMEYGSQDSMLETFGLQAPSISDTIRRALG